MLTSARAVISAAILTVLGTGCRQQAAPPPPQASGSVLFETSHASPKPADAVTPADVAPVAPNPAKAVAQRAASFASSMEPQTSRRLTQARGGDPDWPDPDAMRLTAQTSAPNLAEDAVAMAPANAAAPIAVASVKPTHDAVEPAPRVQPAPAPAQDNALARQLAQRARDYPRDLSAQIDDHLMRFLKDEPVPDLQALADLPAEDRELLSALMDSLTNFRNQLRADNNMLFSKKIRPLLDLSDRLRSQAELSVPKLALCTRVSTYGVYDAIEPARFVAGKAQQSVLYCEVENFFSQLNDKKLYETRLAEDVVLYQESTGLEVWREDRKTITDQSHNRRHDFFVRHLLTLPANLTINRYLLKVTIEDLGARHVAENTIPIEIVAQ